MTCTVCGVDKEAEEFPKNGVDKHGAPRRRTDCKQCYSITRKLTRRKAVTKFLNNTKKRTGEVDTYSLKDWRDVMLHFRGCCAYCGKAQTRGLKLTRDHVIPVASGGATSRYNIVPACRSCNSGKGDRDWQEWLKPKKFYNQKLVDRLKAWVSKNGV